MPSKIYLNKTVLEALHERAEWIFSTFETIIISVSGGKDSTVLYDFFAKEAIRRQRQIHIFFLDQEAEYQSTIDLMRMMMWRDEPLIIPHWYQIPIRMTNATSYIDDMLNAWEPAEQHKWMRDKEPRAIHEAPGAPDRFYPFFEWFETQWDAKTTCHLVGLRSEESLNRYRAVTSHAALPGVPWSSHTKNGGIKLYPIYDFTFEDIWTYIGKFNVPYNRAYLWMYWKGHNIPNLRVSNLIHEKAFQSIADLHEFEPDTYDRLVKRIEGIHAAAHHAKELSVYQAKRLPPAYKTWKHYRDFLLTTIPQDKATHFQTRFDTQPQTENIYRQQCKQLLINDTENNVPVIQNERPNPLLKWMEIL